MPRHTTGSSESTLGAAQVPEALCKDIVQATFGLNINQSAECYLVPSELTVSWEDRTEEAHEQKRGQKLNTLSGWKCADRVV